MINLYYILRFCSNYFILLNLIQIILKTEQIFGIIVIGATTRRRVDGGSLFAGSL